MFEDLDDPTPPQPDAGRLAAAVARGHRRLLARRLGTATTAVALTAVVALRAVAL